MKCPDSVAEADALIAEQESIIMQVDVQVRARMRLVLSGDLNREDFDDWLIRVQERRKYAASDLAELRFHRHIINSGNEATLKELARLRERCSLLQDEVGTSEVRRALKERLARAQMAVHELKRRLDGLQRLANMVPTGAALKDYTLISKAELKALTGERSQRRWRALLLWENAVLHPEHREAFLRYCAEEVPGAFRSEQQDGGFTS